jgi:phage repressor protein C with HTH and peptisase S24 domain
MWPTFDDKALLLVNESETELPRMAPKASGDLDIFVFLQEDHLRVKRLSRVGKEIVATSDNRKYSPEILRGPDLKRLKIIGRVIWWDNRL